MTILLFRLKRRSKFLQLIPLHIREKRRGKRRERGGVGCGVWGRAIENYQQLAYIKNKKQKQKENSRLTKPPPSLNSKGKVTFLTTSTLAYGNALATFNEKWLLRSGMSMSMEECSSNANLASRQSIWVQIKWEREREDRVVPIPPTPPPNSSIFFSLCWYYVQCVEPWVQIFFLYWYLVDFPKSMFLRVVYSIILNLKMV